MKPTWFKAVAGTLIAVLAAAPSMGTSSPAWQGAKNRADKPAAAVLDFEAYRTTPGDAAIVAQFIRSAVVKSGVFAVVDKNNMDKVLNEQAFQMLGCTTAECAVKLGRVLNVRYIILGKYSLFDDARIITAQVVDVENGRIVASESEAVRGELTIDGASNRIVEQIFSSLRSDYVLGGDENDGAIVVPEPARTEPAPRLTTAEEESLPREQSPWKWLAGAAILAGIFAATTAK